MVQTKNKKRSMRTETLILEITGQRGMVLKELYEEINDVLLREGIELNTYNSFYSIMRKLTKAEKIVQKSDSLYYVATMVVEQQEIIRKEIIRNEQSIEHVLHDLLVEFQTPTSLAAMGNLVEKFYGLTCKPSDIAMYIEKHPSKQEELLSFIRFCEYMKVN